VTFLADRRAEILDVAKQIFAEQGIQSTTVRQIGAEAGVLSGSLYHHFDSKLDMVDAILSEFCSDMVSSYRDIASAEGPASQRLGAVVRHGLALIANDAAAVRMFQREAESLGKDPRFAYLRTTEKEVERIWIGVLESGRRSGEFRSDFDIKIVYRILRDVIASSVRWHRSSARSDQRIADELMDVILRGIVSG
jgi:TetR/AcrR family transcriptional regulator, cholesterol catabolism regulator